MLLVRQHSRIAARRTAAPRPLPLRSASSSSPSRTAAPSSSSSSSAASIVVRQPTEAERSAASRWPTWGCGAETFPWTYDEQETCLILEGEVVVTPKDQQRFGPATSAKAGDWAVFPAGMACTWAVSKPIKKHYKFG
jgi:uncharacterized cupin superfamily protein